MIATKTRRAINSIAPRVVNLIFKAVKTFLILTFLLLLFFSCSRKKPFAVPNDSLKFYTAKSIDSIVNIIDSNVSARFLKDDTTFVQFISSKSKRRVKNLAFADSLRMLYYIEHCGLYCSRLRRYYFKNDQLIKVSFGNAESLSLIKLGDYYYSKEKAFLMTTSSRQLPKPDSALAQAKRYLKERHVL